MTGYDSPCCFRSASGAREVRVLWELTTACNLRCGFCHTRTEEPAAGRAGPYGQTLDRLERLGATEVILSGGEPLLWPECPEIVEAVRRRGWKADLCTNATLVGDREAAALARWLGEISVSVDSCEPEVHDALRGRPGAFESSMRGIAALRRAGLTIHAIALVTETTADHLGRTASHLASLGVQSLTFIGEMQTPGAPRPWVAGADPVDLRARIEEARRSVEIPVHTKRVFFDASSFRCPAGTGLLGVSADGRVLPCILMKGAGSSGGDGDWRSSFEASRHRECAGCPHRPACGGGCPGASVVEGRGPEVDPLCRLALRERSCAS